MTHRWWRKRGGWLVQRWWSNTDDIPKSGAGQKETPSANNTPRQQHSRPRNNWLPCLVVDAMKISTFLLLFSRALITELARCHTPNGAFCFTIMLERTLGREFKSFFHSLLIVLRYWYSTCVYVKKKVFVASWRDSSKTCSTLQSFLYTCYYVEFILNNLPNRTLLLLILFHWFERDLRSIEILD